MYLHRIPKQTVLLKKGIAVPLDLKNKPTHSLTQLDLKIEHPSEHSISLLFIFENTKGSVYEYPKKFIVSGKSLSFDDQDYRFEGPIKGIKLISEVSMEITIN